MSRTRGHRKRCSRRTCFACTLPKLPRRDLRERIEAAEVADSLGYERMDALLLEEADPSSGLDMPCECIDDDYCPYTCTWCLALFPADPLRVTLLEALR